MAPTEEIIVSKFLEPPSRFVAHRFSRDIKDEVRALTTDNWHGIFFLGKDLVIILAFAALPVLLSWWLTPVSIIVIASRQRAISTLVHDASHWVFARNKLLNEAAGYVMSWMVMQFFTSYRKSHVRFHHPYLGRLDKDPDLAFFAQEGIFRPRSDRDFFLQVVLLPMLGAGNWRYIRYLVANRVGAVKAALTRGSGMSFVERSSTLRELLGFLAFWSALLGAMAFLGLLPLFLLFWIIPFVTALPVIGWFIELSEHTTSTEGRTLDVHMTRNRRSRHIEKWLFGINNDHYHLDHHLDARTPCWLLRKAHLARLKDPIYRSHCEETGGLFQRGADGSSSIVQLLLQQNRARFERGEQNDAKH
ncbi:dihydrorhizobitoxine desaturase [Mesorhizobium sp. M1A.T.Ca.IN.004.03.1.1]|uniref:fatty acid desaturase n=1 Tax=Mesorhizobium sp. M1A.T.Ca.IN.004.03.1.1 TaxID=2496795 RepID=UPI000FCC2207|nr:fatty acid desaturase [Mesorhizobium sp. M1A.T.Ca.IN.004.03.1.1]RUV41266.1 dihydrorhizobitoxine desaturase [Mesorhizobium sp. M1A.T.Ca.IN.004.03.1.1]